jgi:hypothetical protein
MVKRIWDIFVGLMLIVFGLIIQTVLCGLVTYVLLAALGLSLPKRLALPINSLWTVVILFSVVFMIVNAVASYQFWGQRRTHEVNHEWSGGLLLLVHRGVQRIIRGTELP